MESGVNEYAGASANQECDKYDFAAMMKYAGTSFAQKEMEDPVIIMDLENSDLNERNISTLLSSRAIPFKLERSKSWSSNYLFIHASKTREKEVREIIHCASLHKILDLKKNYSIRGKGSDRPGK